MEKLGVAHIASFAASGFSDERVEGGAKEGSRARAARDDNVDDVDDGDDDEDENDRGAKRHF